MVKRRGNGEWNAKGEMRERREEMMVLRESKAKEEMREGKEDIK